MQTFSVVNHVSVLIIKGDMTVLISPTPNLGVSQPLIWMTKILHLPTTLDPIFSVAGRLEKVYPRFSERPDGPLPESAE